MKKLFNLILSVFLILSLFAEEYNYHVAGPVTQNGGTIFSIDSTYNEVTKIGHFRSSS